MLGLVVGIVREIVAALLLQRWDTLRALGSSRQYCSGILWFGQGTEREIVAQSSATWKTNTPSLSAPAFQGAYAQTKHVMQYRGDFKGGNEQQNTLNAEIPKPGLSTTEAIS